MVTRRLALFILFTISVIIISPLSIAKDAPVAVTNDREHVPDIEVKYNLVRALQKRLQTLGYDPQGVDGLWGDNTLLALNDYRKDKGLDIKDKVDWEVLGLLFGAEAISWRKKENADVE